MSSIRPLVTITILVVVGAYLYVKINEGPVRPVAGVSDKWLSDMPEGVPPLDTTAGLPPASGNTAAAWPATAPASSDTLSGENGSNTNGPSSPPVAADTTSASAVPSTLPAVPAIPELPEVTAASDASSPAVIPSVPLPTSLPENIPTARYPDEPAPTGVAASNDPVVGTTLPTANSAETTVQPSTTPDAASSTSPLPGIEPQQSSLPQNPLRQATEPSVQPDRYASSVYSQNPMSSAGSSVPVEPTFAARWPEIKAALEGRELARAHQLLSKWHEDPSLTPAEAEQVATLLSQLAGTVVYSTEHQLEPARVVKPGETLETIANEYHVPWQLLAKINGVPAADQVRPGQELKVVRGPFSAVVSLNKKQLTLMVDGRYAGRFSATDSSSLPVSEGEWIVSGQSDEPRAVVLTRPDAISTTPQRESALLGPTSLEKIGVPIVCLSEADTNEVSDILSVGSKVIIRR